jgi:hypothetical protein
MSVLWPPAPLQPCQRTSCRQKCTQVFRCMGHIPVCKLHVATSSSPAMSAYVLQGSSAHGQRTYMLVRFYVRPGSSSNAHAATHACWSSTCGELRVSFCGRLHLNITDGSVASLPHHSRTAAAITTAGAAWPFPFHDNPCSHHLQQRQERSSSITTTATTAFCTPINNPCTTPDIYSSP